MSDADQSGTVQAGCSVSEAQGEWISIMRDMQELADRIGSFLEDHELESTLNKTDADPSVRVGSVGTGYQPLFSHMLSEHGLTLLESDMQEIIRLAVEAQNVTK